MRHDFAGNTGDARGAGYRTADQAHAQKGYAGEEGFTHATPQ
jgi:hypothetical protein